MTDRYVVIGNPIAHSKSPQIHSLFAQQTRQDMVYDRLLAPLDGFVDAVHDFVAAGGRGANVTVPFKQEAYALATRLSERAERAQAVNTLLFSGDEIVGDNTDGAGLVNDLALNNGLDLQGRSILIVGAGGAVRGILQPLLQRRPARVVIANRTPSKAEELAESFSGGDTRVEACAFSAVDTPFDLVINGSSSSLAGELPPVPPPAFAAHTWVYDMMYGKEPTVFLRHAASLGVARTIDGLGMLVEQAAEAFALWRGVRPDTQAVLRSLRSEL